MGRSANPLNAPFSFKSSASKKVREGVRDEGGRLGLFAVAGSKKGPLNTSALGPDREKNTLFQKSVHSESDRRKRRHQLRAFRLPLFGVRCAHVPQKEVRETSASKSRGASFGGKTPADWEMLKKNPPRINTDNTGLKKIKKITQNNNGREK